jgi:hypothetical protein
MRYVYLRDFLAIPICQALKNDGKKWQSAFEGALSAQTASQ